MTTTVSRTGTQLWRRAQAAVIANLALQIIIVVTGGAVRLTGSGLGCSTWPACEPGQFIPVIHPETAGHTYIEYGNRLIGVLLGLVGIALAVLMRLAVRELGRSAALRNFGYAICGGIVLQGLIGGVSVWLSLHPGIVGSHFLISGALLVASTWLTVRWFSADGPARWTGNVLLRWLAVAVAVLGVLVVVLGVVVTGAGPHSGDENVGYRFAVDPYIVARMHAAAVWAFTAAVLLLIAVAHRMKSGLGPLRRWSVILLLVTLAQGVIGYVQFFSGLPVLLVGMHLFGAAVLIVVATRTLLTLRQPV
ncbi:MAG: COX15/CtaA family protein [Beutenbergiaceae bacterium]